MKSEQIIAKKMEHGNETEVQFLGTHLSLNSFACLHRIVYQYIKYSLHKLILRFWSAQVLIIDPPG